MGLVEREYCKVAFSVRMTWPDGIKAILILDRPQSAPALKFNIAVCLLDSLHC